MGDAMTVYGVPRLNPVEIRAQARAFTRVRSGVDPQEVADYLAYLAHSVAALNAELDRTRDQNERLHNALRAWQTEQARRHVELANEPDPYPPNYPRHHVAAYPPVNDARHHRDPP